MNDYFKPSYLRWFYNPRTFFDNIISTFRWIKWSWQRAFRGYADCDWWNIDGYFYETTVPLLRILKENRHGYPGSLTDKKWDSILDRMIKAFEAANRVINLDYEGDMIGDENMIKEMKKDEALLLKDGKLFIKYFLGLWD